MTADSAAADHALEVHYDGTFRSTLHPGCDPYRFGRCPTNDLVIGAEPGRRGHHVSRWAGSIHSVGPQWVVCNDSKKNPFDALVGGTATCVPRAVPGTSVTPISIGSEGVTVLVADAARDTPHVIDLIPRWQPIVLPAGSVSDVHGETTEPVVASRRNLRTRRILAVKFLSYIDAPGRALLHDGKVAESEKVAEQVNLLQRAGENDVTAHNVDVVVSRAKAMLPASTALYADTPDALGLRLFHWGVIRPSDRALLRSSHTVVDPASVVRPAGPGDLPMVCSVLGGMSETDPIAHELVSLLGRRGGSLGNLVETVARAVLPQGASLVAPDHGVALVLPSPGLTPDLVHEIAHRFGDEVAARCTAVLGRRNGVGAHRLCAIGVHDVDRAQGIGGALMDRVVARCDAENLLAVAATVPDGPTDRLCRAYRFQPRGHAKNRPEISGLRALVREAGSRGGR